MLTTYFFSPQWRRLAEKMPECPASQWIEVFAEGPETLRHELRSRNFRSLCCLGRCGSNIAIAIQYFRMSENNLRLLVVVVLLR